MKLQGKDKPNPNRRVKRRRKLKKKSEEESKGKKNEKKGNMKTIVCVVQVLTHCLALNERNMRGRGTRTDTPEAACLKGE